MFLPDGLLICDDKMSMAASLELRVPFLDVELMRFVERIPARARVRPRAGKRLHRQAMERLLPPEIASRPKHGFATPYDDWLRSSLGARGRAPLRARRRPSRARRRRHAVARLVDEHRRGRADHKRVLYCLLELSEWHRAFIEAREPVAAEANEPLAHPLRPQPQGELRRHRPRDAGRAATRSRTSTSRAAGPTR